MVGPASADDCIMSFGVGTEHAASAGPRHAMAMVLMVRPTLTVRPYNRSSKRFVQYIEVHILNRRLSFPHGPAGSVRRQPAPPSQREMHVARRTCLRSGN